MSRKKDLKFKKRKVANGRPEGDFVLLAGAAASILGLVKGGAVIRGRDKELGSFS